MQLYLLKEPLHMNNHHFLPSTQPSVYFCRFYQFAFNNTKTIFEIPFLSNLASKYTQILSMLYTHHDAFSLPLLLGLFCHFCFCRGIFSPIFPHSSKAAAEEGRCSPSTARDGTRRDGFMLSSPPNCPGANNNGCIWVDLTCFVLGGEPALEEAKSPQPGGDTERHCHVRASLWSAALPFGERHQQLGSENESGSIWMFSGWDVLNTNYSWRSRPF